MSGDNPYAPPQTEPEEHPVEHRDWFVAARGIHIRNNTTIPTIDLEKGTDDLSLVPVKRTVEQLTSLGWIGPIGIGIFVWFFIGGEISPLLATILVVAYLAASRTIRKFYPNLLSSKVTFTFYLESKSARSYKIRSQLLPICQFCSIGAVIGFLMINHLPVKLILLVPAAVCSIYVLIVKKLDRLLEIRMACGGDLRARIGNAHPTALRKLLAIQQQEEKTSAPDDEAEV